MIFYVQMYYIPNITNSLFFFFIIHWVNWICENIIFQDTFLLCLLSMVFMSLNLGLFLAGLCVAPQILHVSSPNTHPPQGSPTAYIFLYQVVECQEHNLFISYTVKQMVSGLCPLLYDIQPSYQGAIHIWCQNCQLPASLFESMEDDQLKTWHAQHLLQTWCGLYRTDWRIHREQGQRAWSPGHTSCRSHICQLQKTGILCRKSIDGATSQQPAVWRSTIVPGCYPHMVPELSASRQLVWTCGRWPTEDMACTTSPVNVVWFISGRLKDPSGTRSKSIITWTYQLSQSYLPTPENQYPLQEVQTHN